MKTHFINDYHDRTPCGLLWRTKRGKFTTVEYAVTDDAEACRRCLAFIKREKEMRKFVRRIFSEAKHDQGRTE